MNLAKHLKPKNMPLRQFNKIVDEVIMWITILFVSSALSFIFIWGLIRQTEVDQANQRRMIREIIAEKEASASSKVHEEYLLDSKDNEPSTTKDK